MRRSIVRPMTERPGEGERHANHERLSTVAGVAAVFGVGWCAARLDAPWALALLAGVLAAVLIGMRHRSGAPRPDAPGLAPLAPNPLMQAVSDAVPDAVVLFSEMGEIRHANASARALFFDGESPEGQNFLHLVTQAPQSLRDALLSEADELFGLEVAGRRETYHVSRRHFELEGALHVLLVVKHVTREVTRREVEVLKRVVRMVSHEANNSLAPVTSLIHSARLILGGSGGDPRLVRVLDTIEERALHLRSFLDGYAGLARLPKPQLRLSSWADTLEHVRSLYPQVRTDSAPQRKGWFDPVQIEQVLINLCKNALEAGSGPDGIELRVVVAEDGSSEVTVLDRGPGFGAEALQNALLPLFTTKEKGSGMGLALSHEIVEAHGGTIIVANRPDGGGEVRLELPGPRPSSLTAGRSQLTLTRQ